MREIINEVKEFLTYLFDLWGVLSIATPFFPLANQLFKVMPIPDPPPLVIFCVLISGIFIIFMRFVYKSSSADSPYQLLFFTGIASILFYAIIWPNLPPFPWRDLMWFLGVPVGVQQFLIGVLQAMSGVIPHVIYIFIFCLFTFVFSGLAVKTLQLKGKIGT